MTRQLMAGCVLALLATACGNDAPVAQRTDTVTSADVRAARAHWPAGVGALVDSAIAAYSAQSYERASALYRQAAQRAPDLSAAWYGVYIAEHARGNIPAADSALARALHLTTSQ